MVITGYILSGGLLLARGNDSEGWINLLIPVVVAIFWAVNVLAGAAKAKQKQQNKMGGGKAAGSRPSPLSKAIGGRAVASRPTPAQPARTAQRPAVITDRRPAPPRPQAPRRPMPRPQQKTPVRRPAPVRPTAVKPSSTDLTRLIEHAGDTQPLINATQLELPEITASDLNHLDIDKPLTVTQQPKSEYLASLEAEYDNPERLRIAILHSVILGKPKALENPDGTVIGP